MTLIIAIDGPAGAGKGTLSRSLCEEMGYDFLDTGLLYRLVGLQALAHHIPMDDEEALAHLAETLPLDLLSDPRLRSDEAAVAASQVSVHPRVRAALLDFQRNFALQPRKGSPGVVLDGRDIGTRVLPEAHVKFYVTANVEIRAERRLKELQSRGIQRIYADVLRDMKERDLRDSQRKEAPLSVAPDALVLDTTHLSPQDALEKAKAFIKQNLDPVAHPTARVSQKGKIK